MSSPPDAEYATETLIKHKPDPCYPHEPLKEEDVEGDAEKVPSTTVMIYLAGDNNLSEECIYALTELKKARPNGGLVRVLAQYDPGDEFLPTQRYEITLEGQHAVSVPVAKDFLDQYPFTTESRSKIRIRPPYGERKERKGEGSTGDPKVLYNFIAFCVNKYPKTDHYVLIFCGHGAGIYRDFLMRDNRPDGYLTIAELRKALHWMHTRLTDKHGKSLVLDIFGMDVCLMSMAEVTYELRDYVRIAIGCESYSPAAGWPYRQTLEAIHLEMVRFAKLKQSNPQAAKAMDPWELIAKKIVRAYVRFYSDYWLAGLSVTMSALKVRKVCELQQLVRHLSELMILELKKEWGEKQKKLHYEDDDQEQQREQRRHDRLSFVDALILAHWRAQSYNGELYVDLADFCNCLKPYAPPYIAYACKKLVDFIKEDFRIISCSWGRHYQYSYGVSIYFPWDSLVPYYGASIKFPRRSKWANFLKEYVATTRREPRLHPTQSPPDADPDFVKRLLEKNRGDVRMGSDKMGSDKMGSDKGGNPIHSMRNPPIVFDPDPCIGDPYRICHNKKVQDSLMKDVEDFEYDDDLGADDYKCLEDPPSDDRADNADET